MSKRYLPTIATMPLDPNRPMLEQLEEAALVSDRDCEWLDKYVYQHPERLSVLTPIRLALPTETPRDA